MPFQDLATFLLIYQSFANSLKTITNAKERESTATRDTATIERLHTVTTSSLFKFATMQVNEQEPDWLDTLIQWARGAITGEVLIEYLRGLWQPLYPDRISFVAQSRKFKFYLQRAFPEEDQQLLNQAGLYSVATPHSHFMKNRRRNLQNKLNRLFAKLTNEIYGYATSIDEESPPKKNTKKKAVVQEEEELSDNEYECPVCMDVKVSLPTCPNDHCVCYLCFAKVSIQNNGNFICPICRYSVEVCEPPIREQSVYDDDEESNADSIVEATPRRQDSDSDYEPPSSRPTPEQQSADRELRRLRREELRE